ncbi:hypothetical protein [Chromobacterium sp. ATCC 53434]|uniref:hypothetical protein n=2 Tax=Chromobacterium TaxID=535 RepID=UPI0013051D50|nr:hypothetical protein [Chromobacterium sp. ATCC 53434]
MAPSRLNWLPRRMKDYGVNLIAMALILSAMALALEGLSRLFHLGKRPMVPFITDQIGNPRMPPLFQATVVFANGAPFHICTDGDGLRTAQCDGAARPPQVLTIGDSQAFGWGMPFSATFTSRLANRLPGTPVAGLMAVAGTEPESLNSWAADYRAKHPGIKLKLKIICLNLGNDLDEMFFTPANITLPRFKAIREWLSVHSVFMLDFTILKSILAGNEMGYLPPGANPVLFTLDQDERRALAEASVAAIKRLNASAPPAEKTVVLILPNDYQVAPSEFLKYRRFYPSAEEFDSWEKRIPESRRRLDQMQQSIATALTQSGLIVAMPEPDLARFDPKTILDRASHHYNALGNQIIADSILKAINHAKQ